MRVLILVILLMAGLVANAQESAAPTNVFIVTTDGFRWQEVFNGADSALISNETYTKDTALTRMMYWAVAPEERRKKLLPFFWNVIASRGALLGNRRYDSRVSIANLYRISYAGYNEMMTGTTDLGIFSNRKKYNRNPNILEWLNNQEAYRGRVAAFSSWDVFPYIFNEKRSHLPINAGYDSLPDTVSLGEEAMLINAVQDKGIAVKGSTRHDELTFLTALEYIRNKEPRIVYISFGETDEYAHSGRYDLYLQRANQFDKMLEQLWYMIQSTPFYQNNTMLIITTDHGRGKNKPGAWKSHGPLIAGSGEVWQAMIGKGISPVGEVTKKGLVYQKQLPGFIRQLLAAEQEPPIQPAAYVKVE